MCLYQDTLCVFGVLRSVIKFHKCTDVMKQNAVQNASSEPHNLRHYLQGKLLEKSTSNPRYSLRAFARDLGIEASALSKILSGKRRIGVKLFHRLAERLELSPDQKIYFSEAARPMDLLGQAAATPDYKIIEEEKFRLISEWFYYAILELTKIKGFELSASFLSKRLGIGIVQAKIAIETLRRFGWLAQTPEGWRDGGGRISDGDSSTSSIARRKHQRALTEKSIQALGTIEPTLREHSSMTMAIPLRSLPLAKKRILHFKRQLCEELQALGHSDEVYALTVHLFPLTIPSKPKHKGRSLNESQSI